MAGREHDGLTGPARDPRPGTE